MAEDYLHVLQENAQLASQTAQVVARLLETSALTEDHKTRMRPAIEGKQVELALLIDRLGILERTNEIDAMLRAAANVERLWENIASRLEIH
ncbi:MAG: hypothetical protein M9924_10125 [Rhizobiaceae bacterium]|nr:hypothetical protein [Rhizobiaceae bacterium]